MSRCTTSDSASTEVAREHDVELHEVRLAVADDLVVERRVPAAARLQLVVEVEHDLGERQVVAQLHALLGQVVHVDVRPAALLAQLHDRPDEVGRRDDGGADVGLLDRLDVVRVGHVGRAVDLDHLAAAHAHVVLDVRRRREQLEVVLALEALAHDVHVQQPEEAAAKAEAERLRGLRARRTARRR